MNERLRFLRYEEGGFFARHCDGAYFTPDNKQRIYYTVQLYLPSSSDGSAASLVPATGGSTRFHPPSRMSVGRRRGCAGQSPRISGEKSNTYINTGPETDFAFWTLSMRNLYTLENRCGANLASSSSSHNLR